MWYGTAFAKQEELDAWLKRVRDAVGEQLAAVVVAERRVVVDVGAAVQERAGQRLESAIRDVDLRRVVRTERVRVARGERDVVAEDEVAVAATVDGVVARTADEDVAAVVAVDPVVRALLQVLRHDVAQRRDGRRLDALQADLDARRVTCAEHVLEDLALVAEEPVDEVTHDPARIRRRQIAGMEQRPEHFPFDGQGPRFHPLVEPVGMPVPENLCQGGAIINPALLGGR